MSALHINFYIDNYSFTQSKQAIYTQTYAYLCLKPKYKEEAVLYVCYICMFYEYKKKTSTPLNTNSNGK